MSGKNKDGGKTGLHLVPPPENPDSAGHRAEQQRPIQNDIPFTDGTEENPKKKRKSDREKTPDKNKEKHHVRTFIALGTTAIVLLLGWGWASEHSAHKKDIKALEDQYNMDMYEKDKAYADYGENAGMAVDCIRALALVRIQKDARPSPSSEEMDRLIGLERFLSYELDKYLAKAEAGYSFGFWDPARVWESVRKSSNNNLKDDIWAPEFIHHEEYEDGECKHDGTMIWGRSEEVRFYE